MTQDIAEAGPTPSPFLQHRDILLADHSGAQKLRDLVLSLYSGRTFPFDVSQLGSLDQHYFEIAIELIRHYRRHGENDKDFMSVCEDLVARRGVLSMGRPK